MYCPVALDRALGEDRLDRVASNVTTLAEYAVIALRTNAVEAICVLLVLVLAVGVVGVPENTGELRFAFRFKAF